MTIQDMKSPVLCAQEVTVTFKAKGGGTHTAVDGLSLNLSAGETLAIVGQSGSGKTTLLRALLGLVAYKGSVALFGSDLASLKGPELAKLRQRCGYVPQDPYGAIPPSLSALAAVIEPQVIAGKNRTREQMTQYAQSLLSELGLREPALWHSRAVGLSGGQRQRVELARALALDPEILFCDEPTSMQDVSTRGDIIEVLDRRVAAGMAMVFITHDLKLAARAAKRIMVMHQGKLCEEGPSSQVLTTPSHDYTKELMAAIPTLPHFDAKP